MHFFLSLIVTNIVYFTKFYLLLKAISWAQMSKLYLSHGVPFFSVNLV